MRKLILTPLLCNKLIASGAETRFLTVHGDAFVGVVIARDNRSVMIDYSWNGESHHGKFTRSDLRVVVL